MPRVIHARMLSGIPIGVNVHGCLYAHSVALPPATRRHLRHLLRYKMLATLPKTDAVKMVRTSFYTQQMGSNSVDSTQDLFQVLSIGKDATETEVCDRAP